MTGPSLLMAFAVYRDRPAARAAARQFQEVFRDCEADIDGAAVVDRDRSGKIAFHDIGQRSMAHGSTHGAVFGAVVGLLFPPDHFASAFLGATIGGLVGRLADRDLDDQSLRQIGLGLGVGQAAIVVVGLPDAVERALVAQSGYESIARRGLSAELVAAVTDRS
jgi:uncharacterized membrane protein